MPLTIFTLFLSCYMFNCSYCYFSAYLLAVVDILILLCEVGKKIHSVFQIKTKNMTLKQFKM